jgi:hypothetical protein
VLIASLAALGAGPSNVGRCRAGPLPGESAADTIRSLQAYQAAILDQEPGKRRNALYHELFDHIESGHIGIDAGVELDRFAAFLASQLDNPKEMDSARFSITGFLSNNPHPAAGDALMRATGDSHFYIRKNARKALVALRDERILDLLLKDVQDPSAHDIRETFRMIGELGLERAIEPLEAILADSSLEERLEAALRTRQSEIGRKRDSAWFLREINEKSLAFREAVRRALRDIRMRVETGMVMPFDLDDHAHAVLKRQGFVILPETANELYEHLRSEYPYVTVDIVFHAFMLLAGASFDDLERLVLHPRIETFVSEMIRGCRDRMDVLLPGREVRLAHRNIAFFAVVNALLKGTDMDTENAPPPVAPIVKAELSKIREHADVDSSSVFEVPEDFTKYKPRGRYVSSPEHENYFQAMLYLGRMKFRIDSERETAQALLMLDVLETDPGLRKAWKEIDELLSLFFGQLDDPGVPQYEEAVRSVVPDIWGNRALTVLRDAVIFDRMREAVRTQPPPRIMTMVPDKPGRGEREKNRGFRVFGQRYTRSLHVFQQWMDAAALRNLPVFPSGLHVASSLLGSKEAERILRDRGYPPTAEIIAIPKPPNSTLMDIHEGYLECFAPIFEFSQSRPALMAGPAWEKRLLNSALGAWAEVIHATRLYSKDANIYMGGSMMLDRFHGYVEPYPEFFRCLGRYVDHFVSSLEISGLFDRMDSEVRNAEKSLEALPKGHDSYEERTRLTEESMHATRGMFEDFMNILTALEEIARKELLGEGQSVSDGIFLKSLHRKFMHLAFNWSNSDEHRQSMALISDPATDYYSRRCLNVGIGPPLTLYVAVPFENATYICRGPVYSYYEFPGPIEERLDDATWRELSSDLGGDPSPWIAGHAELGFVRPARRKELETLLDYRLPDGRNRSGGREPWKTGSFDDPTKHLVTAEVSRGDIDVLIEMADIDTIHVDVRRFALQKIKDFGAEPLVIDAYRRQLAELERTTKENTLFHTRLYYTIRGLGSCGREAVRELDRAEAILRATRFWDNPKSRVVGAYRSALRESRTMIEAHPFGISRSRSGN